MDESELRAKLERALHTKINEAEWCEFMVANVLLEFDEQSWPDFRGWAEEKLHGLRRFLQNVRQEEVGEVPSGIVAAGTKGETEESLGDHVEGGILSERTAARARALNALDHLHRGPKAWGRLTRHITSRVEPIGRGDRTLPQWVIQLEIEAWVPEKDVMRIYQDERRKLLADQAPTKIQPRTYEVARFVWEQELLYSKRPSWPKLCDRWNRRNPEQEHFKDWRAFRTCFVRGEEATPPRYANGNDHIIGEARRLKESRGNPPSFGLQPPSPLN
jgi:hypothetical protein